MTAAQRRNLRLMLEELETNRLTVVLVPQKRVTNSGGMIRVAVERNAAWYRLFCGEFGSRRVRRNALPDTRIKRAQTLATLRALVAGQSRGGFYASELVARAARFAPAADCRGNRAMTLRLWRAAA